MSLQDTIFPEATLVLGLIWVMAPKTPSVDALRAKGGQVDHGKVPRSRGRPPVIPSAVKRTRPERSVSCSRVVVRHLPGPALWGREITDERYLVVAHP